jgi:hypothetical protein
MLLASAKARRDDGDTIRCPVCRSPSESAMRVYV